MPQDNWRRELIVSSAIALPIVLLDWLWTIVSALISIPEAKYVTIVLCLIGYIYAGIHEARRDPVFLVPLSWLVLIPGLVLTINIPLSFIAVDFIGAPTIEAAKMVGYHTVAVPGALVFFGLYPVIRSRPSMW